MTTTIATQRRQEHLGGLDGLRAIAVLLVVIYHAVPFAAVGGYLGVDLFFVISGFLITGLLLRERSRSGRIRLRGFWVRRARRLLPALALLLVVCTFAAALIGGDVVAGLPAQLLGAATFSSNWVAIVTGADYIQQTAPELYRNLWSLAVEEQFYLLWPLIVLLLLLVRWRTVRAVIALGIAVASAGAMAFMSADPNRLYYGTDTHAFGLALGAALAFALDARFGVVRAGPVSGLHAANGIKVERPRLHRAWLLLVDFAGLAGLAGVLWLALTLDWADPRALGGGIALASALTALVIGAATTRGSWLGVALDVAPMRWVGERSYGIYLWHWPVLVLVAAAWGRGAPWWVVPAIAVPVSFLAAAVSYRFVETPIRRYGLRGALDTLDGSGRAVRTVASSLVATAAVLALMTTSMIGMDDHASEAEIAIQRGQDAIAAVANRTTSPSEAGTANPATSAEPDDPAAFGIRPPAPPVAAGSDITAIGDSVMLASAPELFEAFPDIALDATVSRHMTAAETLIGEQLDAGTLRHVVVLALATNSGFDPEILGRVLALLGPDRQLVLVTGQAPRDWIADNNQAIREFARRKRAVELADWYTAIQPHMDVLAADDVHPGPTGAAIYTQAVKDALFRLTLVPPLPDPHQLRWLPRAL